MHIKAKHLQWIMVLFLFAIPTVLAVHLEIDHVKPLIGLLVLSGFLLGFAWKRAVRREESDKGVFPARCSHAPTAPNAEQLPMKQRREIRFLLGLISVGLGLPYLIYVLLTVSATPGWLGFWGFIAYLAFVYVVLEIARRRLVRRAWERCNPELPDRVSPEPNKHV